MAKACFTAFLALKSGQNVQKLVCTRGGFVYLEQVVNQSADKEARKGFAHNFAFLEQFLQLLNQFLHHIAEMLKMFLYKSGHITLCNQGQHWYVADLLLKQTSNKHSSSKMIIITKNDFYMQVIISHC